MKNKHLIALGALFLALLLLLTAKKIFLRPQIEKTEYESLEVSLDIPAVSSIEIKKPGAETALKFERAKAGWIMPSKPEAKIKSDAVESLLAEMNSIEGEMRSGSEGLFGDYGISDGEAYAVSFYDSTGTIKERLLIGTKKPGFGRSFLRKAGSNDVYLVNKDILSIFGIYGDPKTANLKEKAWIQPEERVGEPETGDKPEARDSD